MHFHIESEIFHETKIYDKGNIRMLVFTFTLSYVAISMKWSTIHLKEYIFKENVLDDVLASAFE